MQFSTLILSAMLAVSQIVSAAPAPEPVPAVALTKTHLATLKVGATMHETDLKAALGWNATHAVAKRDPLAKRDSYVCSGISGHCGQGTRNGLQLDVNNLNGINLCNVGPGPGFCILTQYELGTGIWFCNDNRYSVSIHCWSVAYMAQQGVNACGNVYSQTFSAENFNVIVADYTC